MITCKLKGGLGNQMFQIAATYALARDYNTECAFDFTGAVKYQGCSALKYTDSIFRGFTSLPTGWKPKITFKERGMEYRDVMVVDGMALDGYFQDERYFFKYADEIRRYFRDESITEFLRGYYAGALKNSLSVHVRRGDYLRFADVFHVLDAEYYMRAIKTVCGSRKIEYIFVMSDDIKWCRENLKDDRIVYVSGHPDHHEMLLMSMCSHNVISNSTFSWWGAWLGEAKDKTIVAPDRWLKNIPNQIIPERWVRL